MRVHLGESEIRHGRGLERLQHLVAAHAAGAEFFQESNGFADRHALTMPQVQPMVTPENAIPFPARV